MAISDFPTLTGQLIPPRGTASADSAGAVRVVEYTDPITGLPTGDLRREMRMFNNTGAATVIGDVYQATFSGDAAKNPTVIVCATATPTKNVAVAVEVIADQAFGWFAICGWVNASLEATGNITALHFLKLTSGTSALAFIEDGAAETTSSHAIAVLAITTDGVNRPSVTVPNKVFLLGHRAIIA